MNREPQISTARSTKLWPAHYTPLWHGDQQVGLVAVESYELGTIIGVFTRGPAFDADRRLFENAVAAEKAIATSPSKEYQAAWHAWKEACQRLQQLELSFGDLHVPIEGFTIDADWRVEFESALWWDVLLSPGHGAAKATSRWR